MRAYKKPALSVNTTANISVYITGKRVFLSNMRGTWIPDLTTFLFPNPPENGLFPTSVTSFPKPLAEAGPISNLDNYTLNYLRLL